MQHSSWIKMNWTELLWTCADGLCLQSGCTVSKLWPHKFTTSIGMHDIVGWARVRHRQDLDTIHNNTMDLKFTITQELSWQAETDILTFTHWTYAHIVRPNPGGSGPIAWHTFFKHSTLTGWCWHMWVLACNTSGVLGSISMLKFVHHTLF